MTPPDNFRNIQYVTDGAAYDRLGLVHRVRVPDQLPESGRAPVLVMVHGLDGNEDVTWIFAGKAPPSWVIVTPRAPLTANADSKQYRWHGFGADGRTDSESFADSLRLLQAFVTTLPEVYPVDPDQVVLLGFSQGAAMSYALTTTALKPRGIAALAGYVPGTITLPDLTGLPIYQFNGTLDQTIPIERARKNRDQLLAANADLTYVEDEVGHKVSGAGMNGLQTWLNELKV